MPGNWKKPKYEWAPVEWEVFCPIESYSVSKSISAGEQETIARHDSLMINARVRFPEDLKGHKIDINLYKSEKVVFLEDDPPHKGIGALTFIEKGEHIEENVFYVDQPGQPLLFDEMGKSLLESESAVHVRREIRLKVIGLMNEWDRTGYLEVTEFGLVLSSAEKDRMVAMKKPNQ